MGPLPVADEEATHTDCILIRGDYRPDRTIVAGLSALPAEARGEARELLTLDISHKELAERLYDLRERHHLPGLVLCVELASYDLNVLPRAIQVPFEPVYIDDTDRLRELLADQHHPALDQAPEPSPEVGGATPSRPTWGRRLMSVLGKVLICVMLLLAMPCCLMLPIGLWEELRSMTLSKGLILAALFGVPALLAWIAYLRLSARQWWLVPGGVIVRRLRLLRASVRLMPFARVDSVLVLAPSSDAEDLQATCAGSNGTETREMLSGTEAVCLLAAWQSPFNPPSVEGLEDLG